MKKYLKFVVGVCADFIGANVAIHLVFEHLLNARFPDANFGSFVTAMNGCENHFFLFFSLAFIGGTISCGYLAEKKDPKPLAGICAGLAAGALVGSLSGLIYFYNVYNY